MYLSPNLTIVKSWSSNNGIFCLKIQWYLLPKSILYLRIDYLNLFGSCSKIPDTEEVIRNFIQIYLLLSSNSEKYLYFKVNYRHDIPPWIFQYAALKNRHICLHNHSIILPNILNTNSLLSFITQDPYSNFRHISLPDSCLLKPVPGEGPYIQMFWSL